MLRAHTALLAILACACSQGTYAQRTTPVIRQVDHISIESSDPKALFAFFADTLQLPVAWPISESQSYVTGGIGTGDVNLEIFRYSEIKRPSKTVTPAARYTGIAFEPYPLADALRRLTSLGLPYAPPESTVSTLPNGSRGVAWTTVGLPSVSKPSMSIFLYEYSAAFLKVEVRRKQMGNRLTLNNGGPAGILAMSEIIIAATNTDKDKAAWSLLVGKPTKSGNFQAISGPAIRIASGGKDQIREIVLKVASIDRATAFLKKKKLLGTVSPGNIGLNRSKVQGLQISLADK